MNVMMSLLGKTQKVKAIALVIIPVIPNSMVKPIVFLEIPRFIAISFPRCDDIIFLMPLRGPPAPLGAWLHCLATRSQAEKSGCKKKISTARQAFGGKRKTISFRIGISLSHVCNPSDQLVISHERPEPLSSCALRNTVFLL